MRKVMLTMLLAVNVGLSAFEEMPNEFSVRQDAEKRFFRVMDGERFIGAVVSSDYGQLDFYDSKREKRWMNLYDHLFEGEKCLGWVKVASDEEWFERSSLIEIFSGEGDLLAKVEAEDGNCFIFRDAETKKALAVALWKWVPTSAFWPSFLNTYVQEWSVMIVDRSRLKEKNMPSGMLVWVLMKHTQKHLRGPNDLPYEDVLPLN